MLTRLLMRRLSLTLVAAALAVGPSPPCPAQEEDARRQAADAAIARHLKTLVPELRSDKKLVGLAAMVTIDGAPVAAVADGLRKKGSDVQLDVGDRWHLGSITKSITATVIARLVEREVFPWSMSVGQCWRDEQLHPDWAPVTLELLLTHTGGAAPNFPLATQFRRPPEGPPRTRARRQAVLAMLKQEPAYPPGQRHLYSNVGFTIAGAMAEQVTGKSWEQLVRDEVFKPLELTKAGFGPPQDDAHPLDQPRGHQNIGPFKRAAGVDEDNSPIIGPAGTVHMTLDHLCRYGHEHLDGRRGRGKLLKQASYTRLHTPRKNHYAFGWVVPPADDPDRGGMIWHNGSNTMWYAMIVLAPEHNAVIAVTSNDGDIAGAESAANQIVDQTKRLLQWRHKP